MEIDILYLLMCILRISFIVFIWMAIYAGYKIIKKGEL